MMSELIETGTTGGLAEQEGQLRAAAEAEIRAAVMVAVQMRRNESGAYGRMMEAAQRPSFQDKAVYSYPRGGQKIIGPSVNLAREFARVWGNIRHGFDVVSDDGEYVQVIGYAWDMESNTKSTQGARFRCLVQRKRDGATKWVVPDERDKRELINKHGAIAQRNALLQVLPRDMVEDIVEACLSNAEKAIRNDMEAARKKLAKAFGELSIPLGEVEEMIGCELQHMKPDDISQLRQVYASIKDGNTTWRDHHRPPKADKPAGSMADLMGGTVQTGKDAEPDRTEPVGVRSAVLPETDEGAYELGESSTESVDRNPYDGYDLQDDPEEVEILVAAWANGYWVGRVKRCDSVAEIPKVVRAANENGLGLTAAGYDAVLVAANDREEELQAELKD